MLLPGSFDEVQFNTTTSEDGHSLIFIVIVPSRGSKAGDKDSVLTTFV